MALAGLLGACSSDGGSDDADAGASSGHELSADREAELETESEFAQCVRDHGIDGFPDPEVNEDGFKVVGAPWERDLEAWNEAQQACQRIFEEAAAGETAAGWEKVVPGGDCHCADGSEFAFWERRADPTKVVFFLDGGGGCYDATTCAFLPEDPAYDWNVQGDDPAQDSGIFDLARADNPFRDYSFVLVPSCTGDAHLGHATHEYSPELTVEHNGYVNGTAALDYIAEHYPDAAQVVVVGKTIGSIAAPVYGGLVADRLPDAHVTVFGGQSGHVPDDPDLNADVLGELWGAYGTMPDWEVNDGLTARDWGPRRFWIQAGLHNPEIVLARFDYAYDQEAAQGAAALGIDPSELLAVIDANEAAIEAAGVVQHSYTAPGDGHGIFEWPTFYELEVNGVTLVDWVDALIAGESLEDVHCTQCTAG
jgi:Pectinacetylesterase